jgi:branched-chain amino acid transport system permease protein
MADTIRRYLTLILLVGITIALVVLPLLNPPQTWILYLFYFFVFLAAANMWNLLAGFSGLLALCPAAFIGLGGYTMTILSWLGIPFYVGIMAGGLVAGLFALLISFSVFRMKGIYFAIGTLVVPAILRLVFLRWRPVGGNLQGGGAGYMVKGASGVPSEVTYWLGLVIGLISVILIAIILRSKFGLGLAAIRDNDVSAASSGIDVFRLKLYSFIIAAIVMGMAGAIFYAYQGYIEPNSAFDINWLMIVLLATVIGGIGLQWGPLVGTIIVVILEFQLARYAGISLLIQGIILVIIMLVAPQGILGFIRDQRKNGGQRFRLSWSRQRADSLPKPGED